MSEQIPLTPEQQHNTEQRILHDAELLTDVRGRAHITELGSLAVTDAQWLDLHGAMEADLHAAPPLAYERRLYTTAEGAEIDLSGVVSTFQDMLTFAGEDKIRAVSMAFGTFFRSRNGQDEGMKKSGIQLVDPDGNEVTSSGASLRGRIPITSPTGSIYEGWGVTLESLAKAVETGRLHHIPDLRHRNGSYKLFEDYVSHRLSVLESGLVSAE